MDYLCNYHVIVKFIAAICSYKEYLDTTRLAVLVAVSPWEMNSPIFRIFRH